MDVIRYFNHDHRQRHCQTGYTRKKRDGPEEREGPRVHPGPVFASLYAELIDEKATDHSAVDSTNEQHGYDNPTGDGGAGCPTGHDKVDQQHGGHGRVAELLVCVLGEQVVDGLFAGAEEEGGRLAVGTFPVELCPVVADGGVDVAAGVGDEVDFVS